MYNNNYFVRGDREVTVDVQELIDNLSVIYDKDTVWQIIRIMFSIEVNKS